MKSLPIVEQFWQFSLKLYAVAGVESACIKLQDSHNVNVNILLYLCFCEKRNLFLRLADIEAIQVAIKTSDESLKAHRLKRRAKKAQINQLLSYEHTNSKRYNTLAVDYEQLKRQELELERRQQTDIENAIGPRILAKIGENHAERWEDYGNALKLDASGKDLFYFIIRQINSVT